jgi:nitrate/TMAO reductase-like tetraheme cytochrome c subunit
MKMNVMKSHEESIKAGLTVYTETEKFCVTCHNSESPTFKEFKFDEFWAKIKHIVPKPPTQ